MSRLDYRAMTQEPGPECVCGSELHEVPLPGDIAALSGQRMIWVHVENGDTRCYPDEDDKCTAEPLEAAGQSGVDRIQARAEAGGDEC